MRAAVPGLFVCLALLLSGCAHSMPRTQASPPPLSAMDVQRLEKCQVLASRAKITTPYLTQAVVFKLGMQALRDHGVMPPVRRGRTVYVHRVTQGDIQAAADELKACFPPQ